MNIYLASIATSEYEIENRAYKNICDSLLYIYDSLKSLSSEIIKGCDFFDRKYVREYFTEEFFAQFNGRMNCKSACGEFSIIKMSNSKYQFVFVPLLSMQLQNPFIVCELEILELL
jgi:hypothetical protein